MSKCPRCRVRDLVRRETKESVLLECNRRGEKKEDRECDYVERYSKEEAQELDRRWKEHHEIVEAEGLHPKA